MNRDEFWSLIEIIDRNPLNEGDEDSAIAPLETHLASLPVGELESFEEHLAQCLYGLDGRIYADASGGVRRF